MLKKYLSRLTSSELQRNILTLLKGSAFAQALPILCMPLLARLYTPEEFGLFTLYLSFVLSIVSVIGLRYDFAILLPKNNTIAWYLFTLSAKIITIFSIVSSIVLIAFNNQISIYLKNTQLAPWLSLVGLNLFILGLTQLTTFWFNRNKQYHNMATQRVIQSTVSNGGQIALGMGFHFGVSGLIIGNLLGQITALIYSLVHTKPAKHQKTNKKFDKINRKLLIHFKNFPIYNAPTALIDALRLNGINVLLAIFFTASTLGQFALAWRLLQSPISLINGALSQVYYQHFTQLKHLERYQFLRSCIKKSFVVGIIPFTILFVIAEPLFVIFFGKEWQQAGQICSLLVPWLFLNFITSPISSIYMVLKQEKKLLIFSIFYMLTPLSIIFFSHDSILETILYVSISMSMLLCVFIGIALHLTKTHAQN